jgi:glyoxylase-like metal-dependent hydrolase (beta-lactamase superfamily II)
MLRERVSDNVYVFTSERYAQVNAGAVIGPDWSVLIDTLAFPDEVVEIRTFIEERLSSQVRYVINTHYHTDHTMGNCFFPEAKIISHALCRQFLDTRGREALATAQAANRDLEGLTIKLPEVTFEDEGCLVRVGRRTLQMVPLPGHSPDGIGVLVVEDRVLFSGDVMMPIPYIADGDYDQKLASLKLIPKMKLENLVQGHGESVLRGEVSTAVRANLSYLAAIRKHARIASRRREPMSYLDSIEVEDCGKSRVLMNGLAERLHNRNLRALYHSWYEE